MQITWGDGGCSIYINMVAGSAGVSKGPLCVVRLSRSYAIGLRSQRYQEYLILPDLVFHVQPDDVVGLWRQANGPIPIGARCAWTWGSGPSLRHNFVTILRFWVE